MRPENWQSKADLGWPLLEYVGKNTSELVFKGRVTGRVYRAGNNKFHKLVRVHPDDLNQLLALTCFRRGMENKPQQPKPTPVATIETTTEITTEPVVEIAEPIVEQLTVELTEAEPIIELTAAELIVEPTDPPIVTEPPSEPSGKPSAPNAPSPGNGELDIGTLSIRALRELDLTGRDLESLMQDEQSGKHRRTILAYLRLEQRKQTAVSPG